MVPLPLEVLELEPMASGNQSIRLTRSVSWEMFGPYAERLVRLLEGQVIHTADTPVERVWTTTIDGGRFWLALDDFGLGVSLDPCDDDAAAKVAGIHARLLASQPAAQVEPDFSGTLAAGVVRAGAGGRSWRHRL